MKKALATLITVGLMYSLPASALAGGFALTEKGVKGLGTSYAGGAAAAEDASTIYWNPAGMTRLKTGEIDLGLFVVRPAFEFNLESATNALGGPIPGGDGGDAGFTNLVPNLFVSYNINDNWHVGLGVVVPFGLGTEYDSDWAGRYHSIESDLLTVDINPSVAYRINEQWSVGAGLSFQYLDAELSNAIDFGLVTAINPLLGAVFPDLTPSSPNSDGEAELTGDSWGVGFNLGVLFELSDDTRFGLSYRSQIEQDIEGTTDFTDPAAAPGISQLAFGGDQDSEATIDLPATASLSAFHRLNDQWAVMADVTWTDWSQLEELLIESDGGAPDSVTTFDWDDTWRLAAGVNWYYNEKWTWRSGVAFDPTPVPNAELRSTRVPDEDRLWWSLGGSWKFTSHWSLDFAGTYIWVLEDPELNKLLTDPENLTRGALEGDYDAYSWLLGAQINYQF